MLDLTLMLLALAALLAAVDWRKGLALCVLTGLLQDPLRKLVPNQPTYFVVLVGVVFAAAWFGAYLSRVRLGPNAVQGWRQHLGLPFGLFIALVLAQAAHSFARFGSPVMTGIGLLVWLAPAPAVAFAYQFALRRGVAGVRWWMGFYCVAAILSLTGVYLQYIGYDWPALGEVGKGLVIYDVGTVLKAYSGFYRSSELAAWHTATIACFVFTLFVGKRLTLGRLALALALVGLLLSLGMLTGRRKMLVEVAVFLSAYLCLVAWFQRGAARLAVAAVMFGVVAFVAAVGLVSPDVLEHRSQTKNYRLDQGQKFKGYAVRGQSVFEDIPNRFRDLGVAPIAWAIDGFGWFGAGLGTGSQGTGELEEAASINRGAAEGGLGKIAMELGVPGLLLMAWLGMAMLRYVRRLLEFTARTSLPHARLAYGLVAFLTTKVASFSVAAQVYSDLFVLLLLGAAAGFLLAMPTLAAKGDGARKRTTAGQAPLPAAPAATPLRPTL